MEQEKNNVELEEISEFGPIETQIETEVERAKKKRREAIFEMSLFLILGILIGITLKTEAVKKITIGFNDYQIKKYEQSYDISAMKRKLEDQITQEEAAQQAAQQIQTQTQQNQQESQK
ncbi:MAG: hypothetical protein US63_C0044G0002 [Candidatus Moranbacteria bacterium GW2011_GWC2_37_8]|nr:MAG: hypothetical protein US63_C0044G0002 [Candidatus Moranbacteria bacterium GW2011_GWC2_37_8]KKQ60269.1 MAG: hypothetical protein US82_C0041G0001 [Parcubacteria group bacterium GW2011_GWC1_38_22]